MVVKFDGFGLGGVDPRSNLALFLSNFEATLNSSFLKLIQL